MRLALSRMRYSSRKTTFFSDTHTACFFSLLLRRHFTDSMIFKRYIALFLLVLVSIKTLLVPFVYLDFELRKDYIVQQLCENRFKPELRCDGKCYLAKQLHKVAEDNASKEAQKHASFLKKMVEDTFEELRFTFEFPTYLIASTPPSSVLTHFPIPKHARVLIKPPIG